MEGRGERWRGRGRPVAGLCRAGVIRGHVWALRSPRSPKRPHAAVPGLHTPRKRPSRSRPKISSSHPRAELTLTHAPVTWLSAPPSPPGASQPGRGA